MNFDNEDQLMLHNVNEALHRHESKYKLHMKLAHIRSNSYLLLSRIIKYQDTKPTKIAKDNEQMSIYILKIIQDLEHLS